jgi:N-acetylmuramoyl-L-alanine amidase
LASPRAFLAAAVLLASAAGVVAGCGSASAPRSARAQPPRSETERASAAFVTASAEPAPAAPLADRTITVDPGHNGGNFTHPLQIARPVPDGNGEKECDTTGTAAPDGYRETDFNSSVAERLRALLAAAGAHVVMTRSSNTGVGPCVNERAAIGNRAHSDAAISIHADGGPPDGRGFHVLMPALIAGYTDDIYARSHRLGISVRDAFLATGMPTSTYYATQGLVERSDLGGLNLSNVPKVFIETGNMRNATDASLLESADFRQAAARALAAGLNQYLARE